MVLVRQEFDYMNIGDRYVDPVKGVVEIVDVTGDVVEVRSLLNGNLSHRPIGWLRELESASKPNALHVVFKIAMLFAMAGAVTFSLYLIA